MNDEATDEYVCPKTIARSHNDRGWHDKRRKIILDFRFIRFG